jgi:hypothetical protein
MGKQEISIDDIIKPVIPLDQMSIDDKDSDMPTQVPTPMLDAHIVGDYSPFIKIGKYIFAPSDIESLILDETDYVPTVKVTIVDMKGTFSSTHFPNDRPIMSLYIRSKSEKFKPIRNDFIISIKPTGVSHRSYAKDGRFVTYSITGVLNVPKLFDNISMSYGEVNSIDVLKKIASEIGVGYATNENATDDKMHWGNPNWKRYRYIDFVVRMSYKDNNSFFGWFIDKYYYLNFVNISDMIKDGTDFKQIVPSINRFNDYQKSNAASNDIDEVPLILSNMSSMNGTEMYINNITPKLQQSSNIIKDSSNRWVVSYYDHGLYEDVNKNMISINVDLLNSTSMASVKTINVDDMNKIQAGNWEGICYANHHENAVWAKFNNTKNLNDLAKMSLVITTDSINLKIYRGMSIPVIIVREGGVPLLEYDLTEQLDDKDVDSDLITLENAVGMKLDKNWTGWYIVSGIRYKYDPMAEGMHAFSTELSLSKKSWSITPKPVKSADKISTP